MPSEFVPQFISFRIKKTPGASGSTSVSVGKTVGHKKITKLWFVPVPRIGKYEVSAHYVKLVDRESNVAAKRPLTFCLDLHRSTCTYILRV